MKLDREQHLELARLLNQAADNLDMASKIVRRADYSDRSLHVGGYLQEWLIDPLREADSGGDAPYQSVGYASPWRRKRPPA
jgi:hypothetical protein